MNGGMKAGRLPRHLEREVEHCEDQLGEVAVLEIVEEHRLEIEHREERLAHGPLLALIEHDLEYGSLAFEAIGVLQDVTRKKLQEVRMGHLWPEIQVAQKGAIKAMVARRKLVTRTGVAGVGSSGSRTEVAG